MLIKKLYVSNFRNIAQADITFDSSLNIIYGSNGQGKTNLLEAVYLLALADSYRSNNDIELVRFGTDNCFLRASLENSTFENTALQSELALEIKKLPYNKVKKTFSKDNLTLNKVADFIGNFTAVLFAPEDLLLIKSGPKQRREFINRVLAQSKRAYIFNLQQLNQLLLTKNRLLKELQVFDNKIVNKTYKEMLLIKDKQTAIDRNYLLNLLSAFEEADTSQAIKQKVALLLSLNKKFVEVASQIIFERLQLVSAFNGLVNNYQSMLSLGQELLNVRYLSCVNLTENTSLEEIVLLLSQKVEQSFANDLFKGHVTVGPQRDDLEFYLNEKNCRLYASQGQQRTVILALKLAECDYLTNIKHIKPVLLLDDVLSELDSKRQHALLSNILDRQVILTCTDLDFYKGEMPIQDKVVYMEVKEGEIVLKPLCYN